MINESNEKEQTETDLTLGQSPLVTNDGSPYEITEEGSLGILAMGYVGIMLWREKRYGKTPTN